MPNWCVNQVEISGDESEVSRLIEFVKGEEDCFDFAKIVPPPTSETYAAHENQNDFLCGCKKEFVTTRKMVKGPEGHEYDENYGYQPQEGYWAVNGVKVERKILNTGTMPQYLESMLGGSDICPEHKLPEISSHPDWWYNWNVANWGTKWDASEIWHDRLDNGRVVEEGRTFYSFDTAWSPAKPVVQALSETFPMLTIVHRYCEGGVSYAGEVIYKAGEEVSLQEYSGANDDLPDEAFLIGEDGKRDYDERDYDNVPMTEYESFCNKHFGGIVGG